MGTNKLIFLINQMSKAQEDLDPKKDLNPRKIPENQPLSTDFTHSTSNSLSDSKSQKSRHKIFAMAARNQSERFAQNSCKHLLNQADDEINSLNLLLKQTESKGKKLEAYLCQYLSPQNFEQFHKPRDAIVLRTPVNFREISFKDLTNSNCQILEGISEVSEGISTEGRVKISETETAFQISNQNIYEVEMMRLLSSLNPSQALSIEAKKHILQRLLCRNLTCQETSDRSITCVKYDFTPPNPLLLLSARLNFETKRERISRYVKKKSRTWKERSEQRFLQYKDKYNQWKYKNRKLDIDTCDQSDEQRLQKKVNIYGKEENLLISPKIPAQRGVVPDFGEFLDSPSTFLHMRKESVELDPDICKYFVLK